MAMHYDAGNILWCELSDTNHSNLLGPRLLWATTTCLSPNSAVYLTLGTLSSLRIASAR